MDWFQGWKQVFDIMHTVQKLGWYAVGQQLGHSPDMVGHPGRHGWRDRAPAPRRTTAPSQFGRVQALPQAVMWQDQMIVGEARATGAFPTRATRDFSRSFCASGA